jgi:hypothetical protein
LLNLKELSFVELDVEVRRSHRATIPSLDPEAKSSAVKTEVSMLNFCMIRTSIDL